MFDFAWSEMALIGVVALVVIGPKDLPRVLRTAGIMMRRARGMAREFQNSIDDMIREADLDEFRKEVNETRRSLEQATHVDLNKDSYRMQPASGMPTSEPEEEQLDLGLDQPHQPQSQHIHYSGYDDSQDHGRTAEPFLPFDHSGPVNGPFPHAPGQAMPPNPVLPNPVPPDPDFHPPAP